MQLTVQAIMLTGILIVLGLFLKRWQPPIKEQYIFIILSIVGISLGYIMLNGFQGCSLGFLVSGLTYYKDALVQEAKEVKESFDIINSLKKNENKEMEDK